MQVVSLTEYLLYHLVTPSPQTGMPCAGLSMPATLFYRWSQPYHLYYDDGHMRRLNQDKINCAKVLELMGSRAIWMWSVDDHENTQKIDMPKELADIEDKDDIIKVEYLSKKRIGRIVVY
jgi:hypothetical protein